MGKTITFHLDPDNPPEMTEEEMARLVAMTEEEIHEAAVSDTDCPPLMEAELARFTRCHVLHERLLERAKDKRERNAVESSQRQGN